MAGRRKQAPTHGPLLNPKDDSPKKPAESPKGSPQGTERNGEAAPCPPASSSMSIRLSSFLTQVERGFPADNPSSSRAEPGRPTGPSITILGLARLTLGVRAGQERRAQPLGTILLRAFDLPDGSLCLKVSLSWTKHEDATECVRSIFEKPAVDWTGRSLADRDRLAGRPARRIRGREDAPGDRAGRSARHPGGRRRLKNPFKKTR